MCGYGVRTLVRVRVALVGEWMDMSYSCSRMHRSYFKRMDGGMVGEREEVTAGILVVCSSYLLHLSALPTPPSCRPAAACR